MAIEPSEPRIRPIRTTTCLYLASAFVLYYDHLLTLRGEITFIWSSLRSPSSCIFLLVRYISTILNAIILTFLFSYLYGERCELFRILPWIYLLVMEVLICTIMALRVSALYSRDRRVVVPLALLGAITLAVILWVLSTLKFQQPPSTTSCGSFSVHTPIYLAIPWEAILVFDTVVICLVIRKSYQNRVHTIHRNASSRLLWLIFRDGIIYFVAMGLVNLANIILLSVGPPQIRGILVVPATNFSALIILRLLLNTHESSNINTSSGLGKHIRKERSLAASGTEQTGNVNLTDLYEMTERFEVC